MADSDANKRFLAAHKFLLGEATTFEEFEAIRTLVRGINPKVDKALDVCYEAFERIENLRKGEVIELSAESLSENTQEEKRRKKAILFFIKTWKELKSEVERVSAELGVGAGETDKKSFGEQIGSFGKIFAFAKGPFGIITLLALIIAVGLILTTRNRTQIQLSLSTPTPIATVPSSPIQTSSPTSISTPSKKLTIQVITFERKKIPLSELAVRIGPDCTNSPSETPHYHARNGVNVKAIDGIVISDPGACAFGKVSEVAIQEVESSGF